MQTRRNFVLKIAAAGLAGAASSATAHQRSFDAQMPDYDLPDKYLPRPVRMKVDLPPRQIHVSPDEFALYWTLPDRWAIRYTVGVGRPGLYEPGEYFVGDRREWPTWTPTPGMLRREPEVYGRYEDGVPGGLDNPLGARALYLHQPGRGDTLLRIHGTNDPRTIGRAVSNGCARLVNDQVIDLYDRVPMGARVELYPKITT